MAIDPRPVERAIARTLAALGDLSYLKECLLCSARAGAPHAHECPVQRLATELQAIQGSFSVAVLREQAAQRRKNAAKQEARRAQREAKLQQAQKALQ
jgi:hypothetical protein